MELYNLGKLLSVSCMFCIIFSLFSQQYQIRKEEKGNSVNGIGTIEELSARKLNLHHSFIAVTKTNSSLINDS